MNNELVSIITPAFNSEKFIGETIKSVIEQTYNYWELIITDDFSSDQTPALVSEYAKQDSRIKLHKFDRNKGPAHARNHSISVSKGKYIAFLDADDLWEEKKIEKQIQFMKENKASFTYTSYRKIDENNKLVNSKIKVPFKLDYHDLLKTCDIYCSTVIYDAKVLGKTPMPLIKKRQDYALWLKLLKATPYAYGLNDVLMSYRVLKNSVSRNKFKAASYQFKVYRKFEKFSMIKSSYYMITYMIFGILKNYFGVTRN